MVAIEQGDIVWLNLPDPVDSSPGGSHPAVVLQNDDFNRTRLSTVVVAMITSQVRYANFKGNVYLPRGEGGLPKPSVVNVTQIDTVDRGSITKKLGRLKQSRIDEIWTGVCMVLAPPPPLL